MIRIPSLASKTHGMSLQSMQPKGNVVGIAGSSEVCFSIAWESCATNSFLEATWPWLDGGCIQNCHLWFQLEVGNIRNHVGKICHVFFHDLIHNLSGFCITDIALVSGCFSSYVISTATRRSKIKHDTWWSYDHLLISRDPKTWRVLRRTKVNTEIFFAWDPDVYLDQLMIY